MVLLTCTRFVTVHVLSHIANNFKALTMTPINKLSYYAESVPSFTILYIDHIQLQCEINILWRDRYRHIIHFDSPS